ncbi:hypothetical protein AQJ58_08300 [Streptomyces sp. DSM 15324]|nr:hypothetical protein AQJ58_08300 [Streptomyces sp. DSM 15324]
MPVVLTGTGLTVGELVALADGEAVPAVAPEARERAVRSWRAAQRLAAQGRLYGRGTGVGAHRSVSVEEGDEGHGLRLLRSHAGGGGAVLPAWLVTDVRALRMRPVPPPVPAFTLATAALPLGTEDRPLTADLAAAAELLPGPAQL